MSRPMPPPIAGELVVVALKAENLQHQAPAVQDPFCVFRIGNVLKRTKKDNGGGLYPIWDDQVNMPVPAGHHHLHVQIFDKDENPVNLMAEGIVDLSRVLQEKEHDGYFPLQARGRPHCGDIYLELTFYSAVNTSRPQQQVRYQHPPGHGNPHYQPSSNNRPPYYGNNSRPPPSHHRPHQYHQRPLPPQQQSHHYHQRPLPHPPQQSQPQRPLPHPPQQPQPQPQPQAYHSSPYPPHQARPNHSPYPPRPSPPTSQNSSMYTSSMPSPQPLLSAPFNPAPSPAIRPVGGYPSPQRPPYSPSQASFPQGSPGVFHDPTHRPPPPHHPHSSGYYPPPPPPQNVRPLPLHQQPLPPPPNGYSARPNHTYPPY